jgi:hypothetical protein
MHKIRRSTFEFHSLIICIFSGICLEEKLKDTKGIIRSRKSKDKGTKNDLENIT